MMRRSDLIELIYQFYPAGVPVDHPTYSQTREYRHRLEARQIAVAGAGRWKEMLGRLGARDDSVHMTIGGREDPAHSGSIDGGSCVLGFHVSFLGPYYGIHRLGAAGESPMAERVAREIEETYGFQSVPPEIGYGLVPHVELDTIPMNEASVYECLFSPMWDQSSRDREDPVPKNLRDTARLQPPPSVLMLTGLTKARRRHIIDYLMSLDLPDTSST